MMIAGFVFIGPPPKSMIAMSDKIESKQAAKRANVSTIPGVLHDITSPDEVLKIGDSIFSLSLFISLSLIRITW